MTDDPTFAEAFDDLAAQRVVLCGECTHDMSAFYRARAAITQRLVERCDFSFVAVDALATRATERSLDLFPLSL